jgi:hypothetical protein
MKSMLKYIGKSFKSISCKTIQCSILLAILKPRANSKFLDRILQTDGGPTGRLRGHHTSSTSVVENAEEPPPDRMSEGAEEACTYKRKVSLLPRPAIFLLA